MKYIASCIVWLYVAVFLLPVSTSVAVGEQTGAVCPLMKTVTRHLKQINRDSRGVSGFDLAERFSLRQTSCGGEKICFKLGSAPLIRDTSDDVLAVKHLHKKGRGFCEVCKALKQTAQECGEAPIPGSVQKHMDMALENTVYCGQGGWRC